jgi:Tfp pilus assembly protein PilF
MDTLSLDSLYSESRLRIAWAYPLKERLWAGLALARMGVTYGSDPLYPVLDGTTEMSAMGLDIGAIYSGEGADFGLSIQNANEPDLGIKYANKVDRKITLGMALKRQTFTWNSDLSLSGQDVKIKTGAEVPVMREAYGDRLQARGGFSVGSRDYRSLAAGFGYRRASYRVDYSFVYPLSGLADTMGSHQLGLFVAWGEPRGPLADRENQYSDEAGEKGRGGGGGDGAGEGEGAPQKTEPSKQDVQKAVKLLRQARLNLRSGAYAKAEEAFKKADELLMNTDPSIKETMLKMGAVSGILPEATGQAGRDDLLRKSVNRYADKNTDAVLYITYARQRWPRDIAVARLYNLITREFPETASGLRILPGITIIDQLLQDALDFIRNGRFIQAISTLQRVLQLEPDNIPALTRMGSAYWAMEKKDIARRNWRRVLELDPGNTEVNQFMRMN